ncbi:MAG: SusC/RagA family TonB-linked outer membrane protein, partial [Gemmatimonadetes bacterium]|nr:SusC/RagA family TonB-linked outer membrane protein [Gemmatimonadota bacterium]
MKKRLLMVLMGMVVLVAPAWAQQKTVSGRVTNESGQPMVGVQVGVKGTNIGTLTTDAGAYTLRASVGQVLIFRLIGNESVERVVGADNTIDVQLKRIAMMLDATVISALGETSVRRF